MPVSLQNEVDGGLGVDSAGHVSIHTRICVFCMFVEAVMALETFLSGKWCLIIHKQMYTRANSPHNSLQQNSLSMMLETHCSSGVHVSLRFKMRNLQVRGSAPLASQYSSLRSIFLSYNKGLQYLAKILDFFVSIIHTL